MTVHIGESSDAGDASVRPLVRREIAFAAWGVLGVALMLLECVVRLGLRARSAAGAGLAAREWLLLLAVLVAFAYGEGYLALHKRFAPAVIARVFDRPTPSGARAILAPLYALGLISDDRAAMRRAWCGLALIVAAAVGVRSLPSPIREIVDAGVALALAIGLGSLTHRFADRLRSLRRRGARG